MISQKLVVALSLGVALLGQSQDLTTGDGGRDEKLTRMYAFWNAEAPETRLELVADRQDLESRMQLLAPEGWRLEGIESWELGRESRLAGIFRQGEGVREFVLGADRMAFNRQRRAFASRGLRLIDIEVRPEERRLQFSGVWAPATEDEIIFEKLTLNQLDQEWRRQRATHRLMTFTTWREGQETFAFAVFRQGARPGEELVVGQLWDDFRKDLARRQTSRLIDFEFSPPGTFSAVFVPGGTTYRWVLADRIHHILRADELLRRGYGTTGIDFWTRGDKDQSLPVPGRQQLHLQDFEALTFKLSGTPTQGNLPLDGGMVLPPDVPVPPP